MRRWKRKWKRKKKLKRRASPEGERCSPGRFLSFFPLEYPAEEISELFDQINELNLSIYLN